MLSTLSMFLVHLAVTALSLWLASKVFKGLHFTSGTALLLSALLLGFVNGVLRPVLVVLTFPLTMLTLGLFLLVLNALLLMLVARLVKGFGLSGFWTAFFASIFITLLGLVFDVVLFGGEVSWDAPMPTGTPRLWL